MSTLLKKKHELSVIKMFMDRFRKTAETENKRFIGATLDGQDTWTGADCLISEGSHFAIAEFKYQLADLKSENTKPARSKMCTALMNDSIKMGLHEICHLMAWSVPDDRRTITFNCYSKEICNSKIWENQSAFKTSPDTGSRQNDKEFIKAFFSGKVGLEIAEFQEYVEWLSSLGDTGDGGIELLIENPDQNAVGALEFTSISQLKQWMDDNPPPTPTRPASGPSFGP